MDPFEVQAVDESARAFLADQNNLKQQPTLSGYIPDPMTPENSPFQEIVPTAAPAPLTESALRQLQQAQAEEAFQQQQLYHLRGGCSTPEYLPQKQSPIPPGSPAATISSAGDGASGGYRLDTSLSQQSPFAFAAQQPPQFPQQLLDQQQQGYSRDVSGGSHLSPPGEANYFGAAVSPQSGGVGLGAVNSGGGRGSPVSPRPPPAAALPAAPTAFQWQQQQSQQQHALAGAAALAQRVSNQKALEQQHAAVLACQAVTTVDATNPLDLVDRAQAALNAVQAQSVYEIASQDAMNAQSRATQLRQAAFTASLQPPALITPNADTSAVTTALPQFHQHQHVPVVAPADQIVAPLHPLVQAAIAAKHAAAQKQVESQAAASAYQNAAVQAASAVEPAHVAVANAIAQQAALMYETAVNEAVISAAAAARLEQAAATATSPAPAVMVPPIVPLPAAFPQQLQLLQRAVPPGMQYSPPQYPAPLATTPSNLFVTPSTVMAPSSALGALSLSDSAAQSSISSGITSVNVPIGSTPVQKLRPVAVTAPPAASSPPPPPSPPSPSPPPVVKAVCSSGGSFIRGSTGSWDYEGGETRLINIPYGCSAAVLFSTLERATSSLTESSGETSEYSPTLKYRLPSDPDVWVDLVDDDDVEYMFEEWQDACLLANQSSVGRGGAGGATAAASPTYAASSASAGSQTAPPTTCKLHIFVQWRRPISSLGSSSVEDPPATRTAAGGSAGRTSIGQDNTAIASASAAGDDNNADCSIQVVTPEQETEATPGGTEENKNNTNSNARITADTTTRRRRERQRRVNPTTTHNKNIDKFGGTAAPQRAHSVSIDLPDLIERMEIIQPSDISLVKFLGSGGYGDVYLGRWHGCEVAVKCLNPSLFFQEGGAGGAPGGINRAAVADLIHETDIMGSLRHPNVVWVYGMVLPASSTKPENEGVAVGGVGGSSSSESDGDGEGGGKGGLSKEKRNQNIIDVIQAEAGQPSMMPGVLRPPALVTEYMAGGSLKVALQRKSDIVAGPLTRIILALDAAKGVEYLHSKRLVHFDLKSGNLLLGYRDRRPICKVADFGLAREKAQTFVSGVTAQRGTLPWIAPEILRTPDAVTEAADVYSFAIVMWELWTGREPWENTNSHALMLQLANPELKLRPPIPGTEEWDGPEGSAPPELAPGWRNLMERCWEEDPNKRPPFTQIVKELRGMVSAIRPPRGGRGEGIGGGNGTGVVGQGG